MSHTKSNILSLLILLYILFSGQVFANSIAQSPLFLEEGVPPIVMITMGRDHKLYYEAYNDASDLDGDKVLDIRYKPNKIDYFGYFDLYKCYSDGGGSGTFTPVAAAEVDDSGDKVKPTNCGGQWSGDFLNYLTTSRMDALRKVLYGGFRSTDDETETILKRAFIPQDAHSWGKQYTSYEVDKYYINHYAPIPMPNAGRRHLFANTTLTENGIPLLRRLENSEHYIWEWVSKERPVAHESVQTPEGFEDITGIIDLQVYVKVCVAGMEEENCKAYSDNEGTVTYKPTGVLQRYGEDELMSFGLLTSSYYRNQSGGVIRKNISSFQDEVNLDNGIFEEDIRGIVNTIDKLRIEGFKYPYMETPETQYCCRYQYPDWTWSVALGETKAPNWGNPIAEMMYEGLRYFSGKTTATPEYAANVGDAGKPDSNLGLPLPAWQDPYRAEGGYPSCAKPIQLVISDVNNSYDSDQLPGSYFPKNSASPFVGDLPGLDVKVLADTIWAGETEATNIFIGQSGTDFDGTPSAKTITSFSNIRGLTPEEPTKAGSYYAGSVALYGKTTDIHTTATGDQNVDTIAVVLASTLPRIEITFPSGKMITVVPFAKSVSEGAISPARGDFQPTNQIVDFYIKSMVNMGEVEDENINGGRAKIVFGINYEDLEQGGDHDMDAMVDYTIVENAPITEIDETTFETVTSETLTVSLDSTYASGGIVHHIGYVISGTTNDGTYLEVRDHDTQNGDVNHSPDIDYFLDTPPSEEGSTEFVGEWDDGELLPLEATRTFKVGSSASASFIKHPPLWYAAKWSMTDDNKNGTLETAEWDRTGGPNGNPDGNPDGYFLVTNAGKLEKQLEKAFAEIEARTSSAAAVASNSTRLDANTKIYQAKFNTANWDGELLAFAIEASGAVAATHAWKASEHIPNETSRKVYSYNPVTNTGIEFKNATPAILSATQLADLGKDITGTIDSLAADRINYIRGDQSEEVKNNNGDFRNRTSLLGDVINSAPWFVGNTGNFGYSQLSGAEGSTYFNYRRDKSVRKPALYFGSNDGMLHAVNANDGLEFFTYVPDTVISSLNKLTSQDYGCNGNGCIPHQYFVDGSPKAADAYVDAGSGTAAWHTILVGTLGAGGKGIFALDVTNPEQTATSVVSGLANSSLSAFSESNILWEISNTQSPKDSDLIDSLPGAIPAKAGFANNLGYTLGQASIVRMSNGKWAAIVSNGYESVSGKAVLFIIDIETGELLASLDTEVGSSGSPNGLSEPIAIDKNGDMIVDSIYAGDLQGNLWKFDVTGDVDNWKVADVVTDSTSKDPLFVAKDADGLRQAITAKPQVGFHPDGGQMIYFGTGKYYAVNDQIIASPPKVHTFYGIRDLGVQVESRANLQQQSILYEASKGSGINVRVVSNTTVDYTSKKGWYMDLVSPGVSTSIAKGERVVNAPLLRDGRIIFTTLIPTPDPCGGGGDSWLMEFDALNGKRLDGAVFGGDIATITINGTDVEVTTSGVNYEDLGIVNNPAVISNGDETKNNYLLGSQDKLQVVGGTDSDPNGRQSWQQIQ